MTTITGGGVGAWPETTGGANNPTGNGGAGTNGGLFGGGGGGAGAVTGGTGGEGRNGIGAGGAGGVHGYLGAGLPINQATGTAGANGADDSTPSLVGGGGGGYGGVVTGAGSLGTLTANVSGAKGGDGGYGYDWTGGGGRGGIGLYLDSMSAKSLTISSSVAGGNGGAGGITSLHGRIDNSGSGGEGVYGSNLSITVTSGGTIAGGLSGDGLTRNNAIYFETGTNLLDFQGGTITGNVVGDGTSDTLKLSGNGGSFDVSVLLGFERLETVEGTWTLTGTNNGHLRAYTYSEKTIVNASMANTSFEVYDFKTLSGSGTVGAVDVGYGAHISPGDGIGILNTGNFDLSSGTLDIEISGTTVGTQHDQIKVTGTVTLGGSLNVSLLNSFLASAGNSFTIIKNDGSEAVAGIFRGLSEGYTIIVNSSAYTISYHGGDGNDVVLTNVAAIVGGGEGGSSPQGGINNPTGAGGNGGLGDGGSGGGAGYLVGGSGGGKRYPDAGEGGTGGVHGYLGSGLPISTATGTDGGDGGDATRYTDGGGGGGGGGYGAVILNAGNLGTLTAEVAGGDGGDGGDSGVLWAGDGGRGGIALYFNNTANTALTISTAVSGGDGGSGGTADRQHLWGNAGSGGEGIYGQNLSVTLASGGSIAGGLGGDGVTRANAILFTAGTNLLDIQGGTITGNVVANGSDDTFRLSGSTGGSFDISRIQGFEHLGSMGSATWTLTGTNSTRQSWSATAGTLVVDGNMANTDFTIYSSATLRSSGTVGDVLALGSVSLGDGVGILHTGDFAVHGRLTIKVEGTTAGSGYDQISVTGMVTLDAVLNLKFSNGYAPAIGESVTIVDNDGTDAVWGNFSGLIEGGTYIESRKAYQITYQGGDGNDIVLTRVTAIVGGGSIMWGDAGGVNNPTGAGGAGRAGGVDVGGGGGGAGYLRGGAGGSSASSSAGTGGTGGIHGYLGASLPLFPAAGTDGSRGGDGVQDLSGGGGGGGGGGGYGAVVTGSGDRGTQSSNVAGGDGGDGGNSNQSFGGGGGRGGIGLYFNNSDGASLTVSTSVTGGDGGAAGYGRFSGWNGEVGAGGEGIYGQNLSVTLGSGGSISGGLSGDDRLGGARVQANAILFTSGTNLLDIQGGTITGNVVANGSDDTFRLSGSTGGSFDISRIQGFEHLGSMGSATWTLTGTNATRQSWSATAGTLVVNGTMANTDFTIGSGTTLGGSGTVGNVTVQSDGSIGPGNGPGILSVGDFSLSGTLEIEISGTTVGTQYDQVSVTGTVTLGGDLSVSMLNSFLASGGDSFTIIDNDNADAVSGTFSGLVEGAFLTVGGNDFQITYQGGDGNDVVLTSVTLTPTESANTGSALAEGSSVIITTAELAFSDLDQTAAELVYTVTSAVTHGTLYRNGVPLGSGGTFTQADIDNNRITYRHDGGETTSASFGFSISDGHGGTVTGQSFSFAVTPVNDAPTVANAIADQIAAEDQAFSFQFASNVFADVDTGDTLTYMATLSNGDTLPSWLTFDAATRTFAGTPANGDVGTVSIKLTASDGTASISDTFDIVIGNTNDGPTVANTISDQSTTEDQAFSFQFASGTFADIDGDTLTYTAARADGSALPSWLSFDAATRTFSGVPANGDVGTISIKVTASDGSLSTANTFDIVVSNTNDAPVVANAIADQSATEDSAFAFQFASGTFADVDLSDTLTYTATRADGSALPSWLSFDAASRTFSGMPANGDVGTISVKVTASDGTATVSDSFDLTVGNTNDAPVVANAIANQVATEDQAFAFQFASGTFADIDPGDTLTYTATRADGSALPLWLNFDAATRTFSGMPANGDVGTVSVRVTASDGTAAVSDSFDITVGNTNDAPVVANAIADQSATEDSAFAFQFASNSFADIDPGDTLTYTATRADGSALPSWLSFDAATRTFSGMPANGDVGTISVKVTASDGTATVSDSFDLTVGNANDAPVDIDVVPSTGRILQVRENTAGGVIGTVVGTDPDKGDTLDYSVSDNRFHIVNGILKLKDGVSLDYESATQITVTLTVTDAARLSYSEVFEIAVKDDPSDNNSAPFISSPNEDVTVPSGGTLDLLIGDGHFVDAEGTDLDYLITVNGDVKPAWLTFDAQTGQLTGTPTSAEAGSYVIAVTATDGSLLSPSDAFTLVITNPTAPPDPRGTRRNDNLVGSDFDNIMDGRRGNDRLTGNGGADTFVLGAKYGRDVIMDFNPEEGDRIDLSNAVGIRGFRDLMNHHVVDIGEHLKILADDGSVLIIRDFEPGELSKDMFLF